MIITKKKWKSLEINDKVSFVCNSALVHYKRIIQEDKKLCQLFFDTTSDNEIKKLDFLIFKEFTSCKNHTKKYIIIIIL